MPGIHDVYFQAFFFGHSVDDFLFIITKDKEIMNVYGRS